MNGRTWLALEFLLVYMGMPLLYMTGVVPGPKILVLLVAFGAAVVYLLRTPAFSRRELFHSLRGHGQAIRGMLLRSAGVAVVCVGAVLLIDPHLFLGFPMGRPGLWLLVMVLYPLLSAYPQELLYRSFLFTRYRPLFVTDTRLLVVSTLAFSYLHIIFGNWIAVVLTIPAGYVFTRTYMRTESLLLAAMEHALYGCIVFTSGLGRFLYTPS